MDLPDLARFKVLIERYRMNPGSLSAAELVQVEALMELARTFERYSEKVLSGS
jgi:hypothetical protein